MTTTVAKPEVPDVGTGYPTVASRIREWARRRPHAVAMREKDYGIWQEKTWAQLWDEIVTAAHGLLALGVHRGQVVSIHSEDRPEWVLMDAAAGSIRGISTGLYPTNPTAEVKYLLGDSGAVVHIAEDQEQVD
ncbi:MAG: AMP-binding protein, partial [Acidimicrobiia bacterium]